MKKKIIILTLCFTIFISSINFNKVYADGGIISVPMLALVCTLAVGTGIAIENSDDIYDMGRLFYDYVSSNNEVTWDLVKTTFNSTVAWNDAKQSVNVGDSFLDIVKGFFDTTFSTPGDKVFTNHGALTSPPNALTNYEVGSSEAFGKYIVKVISSTSTSYEIGVYFNNSQIYNVSLSKSNHSKPYVFVNDNSQLCLGYTYVPWDRLMSTTIDTLSVFGDSVIKYPYSGGYYWEKNKVNDKGVPVPNDLSNLLNKNPSDVWDNDYPLAGDKPITYPDVSNPSISLDGTTAFPNDAVTDTPTDTPAISFPSFGDALDFSLFELTGLSEKFPFSLPWDIKELLKTLDVEPKAPVFDVPIVTEKITVDLSQFDEWANIARWFITISFTVFLILISTKMKG